MRVLSVDPLRPDAASIAVAARVLREGGLVVFPTETVYGLGSRALDPAATARIFAVKGRPSHHPLIAHVATQHEAEELAAEWPSSASCLAAAFWPGPLTLVVARASFVPDVIAGGGSSLAVRAPAHPVARALLQAVGEPVAAPSANRYQGLSPTRAHHAIKQLGAAVDLVLDGGDCEAGIESTVVDVRGGSARVLRPGAVPIAALRHFVPKLEFVAEQFEGEGARPAPGMDPRHYAPRATLLLASGADAARRSAGELAEGDGFVGLVTFEQPLEQVRARSDRDRSLCPSAAIARAVLERVLPRDPQKYARRLFATLHELDDAGVGAIVVERVPDDEAWCAVADRLARAASKL